MGNRTLSAFATAAIAGIVAITSLAQVQAQTPTPDEAVKLYANGAD